MILRQLTRPELRKLYQDELTVTFPPEERKPLSAMERLVDKEQYEALGLFEGTALVGYAFLWTDERNAYVLLDYLGITASRRNSGLGTALLGLVGEHCGAFRGILVEAEAPSQEDSEENMLCQRRLEFYQRSGFVTLDYDCTLFGVFYRMLILTRDKVDSDAAMLGHRRLYQEQLPPKLFEQHIQIPTGEWTQGVNRH